MTATPDLSRKLALETLVRSPDGAGGYFEHWQVLGHLWAEIRAGSGREADEELLALSSVPYRITVRSAPISALSRPHPGQRFRDQSRVFRILAVAEADPKSRYLTCFTREEEVTA